MFHYKSPHWACMFLFLFGLATTELKAQTALLFGATYSDAFVGQKMASGETYDPSALTIAHRSLPFGTRVRLTDPENKRSVDAFVNDRMTIVEAQDIRISKRIAVQLGILYGASALLQVEQIVEEPPVAVALEKPEAPPPVVQNIPMPAVPSVPVPVPPQTVIQPQKANPSVAEANAVKRTITGVASYYADKFNGRQTASGEIFNNEDYTAAHRTLMFGTRLRVTNLSNGRSVEVRVNDRGPFTDTREIDLSRRAAVELDFVRAGMAQVQIEILSDAPNYLQPSQRWIRQADPLMPPQPNAPQAAASSPASHPLVNPAAGRLFTVQLGSYSSESYAQELGQQFADAWIEKAESQTGTRYRVNIGRFQSGDDAKIVADRLAAQGKSGIIRSIQP